MTYRRDKVKLKVERKLNSDLSPGGCFHPAIEQGAQVYHYNDAYNTDLGALRTILRGRPVAPKVQRGHSSDIKKLGENMQNAMDKKIEELRCELEESIRRESRQKLEEEKRRARREADMIKKQIAEMQSKEEIARKDMIRQHHQELEEQERRGREEADGLRNRIAEMQSKLEEDRHTSGEVSAIYLNSRHVPSHPI